MSFVVNILACKLKIVNNIKRHNKMVDRIRWDTVSYLPFYYVFFQFLLLTIFNLQANILTTKEITLKPGLLSFIATWKKDSKDLGLWARNWDGSSQWALRKPLTVLWLAEPFSKAYYWLICGLSFVSRRPKGLQLSSQECAGIAHQKPQWNRF